MSLNLRELLDARVLIGDGAVGTLLGERGVCLPVGLMPLRSAKQAEFLRHEVPGISIPRRVRERLAGLSPEDAPKYGVEVAQNLLALVQPLVDGSYIMPPASAPDLAGDVPDAIGLPSGI